ncbi:hypothetical protein [Actinocorallia libanotica]|uniref:Uncharacterized protein n=1 Tax=Actinocorallia libanotica TaxID=46162 RepID=A0ABN1RZ59_9ACTN
MHLVPDAVLDVLTGRYGECGIQVEAKVEDLDRLRLGSFGAAAQHGEGGREIKRRFSIGCRLLAGRKVVFMGHLENGRPSTAG